MNMRVKLADQRQPIPGTDQKWLPLFYSFIEHIRIQSKDIKVDPDDPDSGKLVPFLSQRMAMEHICDGLDNGIRFFVSLKARQLGITTIYLAMDLFWLVIHPNLQGALVTDDEPNREKLRLLLEGMIKSLPRHLRPKIVKHNRDMLVLQDGSSLDYLVAGRKRGKSALGISRAYNFVHGTEVSRWGDPAGVDNLMASMSEVHPDRLYLFESTAHGYNHFRDLWNDSIEDSLTRRAFFIGWWGKDSYRINRDDPRFKLYMHDTEIPPEELDAEREKTQIVSAKYGFRIEPEQIAWYRYFTRTRQNETGSMEENYPWHEDEAFVLSGTSYFNIKRVDADLKLVLGNPAKDLKPIQFKGYRYHLGTSFLGTDVTGGDRMRDGDDGPISIEKVATVKDAELRVWEEPNDIGYYAIGCDPAYGSNEWKNNHCISVWRCYADQFVQVAEYASYNPETYQIAWVLAHLAGIYRKCIINYEVTGPGNAIMREMKNVQQQLRAGMYKEEAGRLGITKALNAARWYLYHRPDSMGSGFARGWQTTSSNKHVIFTEFRDSHATKRLTIRSRPMLEEMTKIVQDGDEIGAKGRQKDDRVFAACLAHKAWVDHVRPNMIARNETFEHEMLKQVEREKMPLTFQSSIITGFFKEKEQERRDEARRARWGNDRLAGR